MAALLQIAGAVTILVAFGLSVAGRMGQRTYWYLGLNLVGSLVLAVLAYAEEQWGFLLLETVWAAVSAWGLAQLTRVRVR